MKSLESQHGGRGKAPAGGAPPEREATIRVALHEALLEGTASARELSTRLGIRERDVASHLEHLARSVAARGERLAIEPAFCLACGFLFSGRKRFTTPGRCPRCSSERIEPPAFHLERGSRA